MRTSLDKTSGEQEFTTMEHAKWVIYPDTNEYSGIWTAQWDTPGDLIETGMDDTRRTYHLDAIHIAPLDEDPISEAASQTVIIRTKSGNTYLFRHGLMANANEQKIYDLEKVGGLKEEPRIRIGEPLRLDWDGGFQHTTEVASVEVQITNGVSEDQFGRGQEYANYQPEWFKMADYLDKIRDAQYEQA